MTEKQFQYKISVMTFEQAKKRLERIDQFINDWQVKRKEAKADLDKAIWVLYDLTH